MSNINKIEIRELDPDIIPPITSRMNDPNYNGGCKLVVVGKPGCFAPGTEVLMHNGEVKCVEDVRVGDVMMGDDSTPRNVIELCHNTEMMYKIIPDDGGKSYTVNENHILSLIHEGNFIEITVKEFLNKPLITRHSCRWYRNSVEFPENNDIGIDPYLLGYWLGSRMSEIDMKKFESENSSILKDLNLIGNKHIPLCYKVNSVKNRMELIAGIVDSDEFSYYSKLNGYDIVNSSEKLIKDVMFVARSLGFHTYNKDCRSESNETSYYNCFITSSGNKIPCRTNQKHREMVDKYNKTSFSIEKLKEGEYYGFVLDGNHRFLGEDFSVLHNTGKSTLIKALLHAKKHIFPVGMAMSGSEDSNHCYREFMPSTFVFNEYNEDKIVQFIKRQKLASAHLPNPWAVMILDDCTDDPRIFNKPLQQALFKKGRHWRCLYILSLQYAMDVKPVIRTNVDGIFILREPLLKNRESLYKNYASIIPDFTTFCDLMDQLTDDYCAIYIHGTTQTNTWQECVFYWKAPQISKNWKLGCPEYWDFHEKRFNENYKDDVTGY